jgi:hypothetical protein
MSTFILENLLGSDTFWIAVGSVGALVTLVFIYYQIKTSRMIAAADFLLKLVHKFDSKEMRSHRKKLMTIIKENPKDNQKIDTCKEVLDFFDDVGLLLRKKVIPIEFVWSSFCYWILRYNGLLKGYIDWARGEDPTYYDQFEYLAEKTLKFEEKKRHKKIKITSKQLQEFIHEEMRL